MKYEVEHVQATSPDAYCAALIAMLTGYSVAQVWSRVLPRLRKQSGWYGRDFVATFQNMGYDCSPRFRAFEYATEYPCLLRYGPTKNEMAQRNLKRPWWNVVVFYDELVYDPRQSCPYTIELLSKYAGGSKITSMMQVWIANR